MSESVQRDPDYRRTAAAEAAAVSDLARQLEDLLDQVWRCEKEWSFDNRIALSVRLQNRRPA